ncbi:hypothetical protein BXZ70DRAFT_586987 [Cristinia sonorae]|uniref:Uncharacterized protein n=1 Tax=Cristinia sonorae TaxID=1940300 RepID=A0A8K0XKL1_9AGAR|nr:hypothetical protein BXZ70DRAFT_586987 [Cristinia sonorae]
MSDIDSLSDLTSQSSSRSASPQPLSANTPIPTLTLVSNPQQPRDSFDGVDIPTAGNSKRKVTSQQRKQGSKTKMPAESKRSKKSIPSSSDEDEANVNGDMGGNIAAALQQAYHPPQSSPARRSKMRRIVSSLANSDDSSVEMVDEVQPKDVSTPGPSANRSRSATLTRSGNSDASPLTAVDGPSASGTTGDLDPSKDQEIDVSPTAVSESSNSAAAAPATSSTRSNRSVALKSTSRGKPPGVRHPPGLQDGQPKHTMRDIVEDDANDQYIRKRSGILDGRKSAALPLASGSSSSRTTELPTRASTSAPQKRGAPPPSPPPAAPHRTVKKPRIIITDEDEKEETLPPLPKSIKIKLKPRPVPTTKPQEQRSPPVAPPSPPKPTNEPLPLPPAVRPAEAPVIQKEISSLKADIASLKAAQAGLRSDQASLKADHSNLSKTFGALEVSQSTLKSNNASVSQRIDLVITSHQSITNTAKNSEATIGKLKTKLEETNKQVETLHRDAETLRGEMLEVRKLLEDMKRQKEELEATVGALARENRSMQEEFRTEIQVTRNGASNPERVIPSSSSGPAPSQQPSEVPPPMAIDMEEASRIAHDKLHRTMFFEVKTLVHAFARDMLPKSLDDPLWKALIDAAQERLHTGREQAELMLERDRNGEFANEYHSYQASRPPVRNNIAPFDGGLQTRNRQRYDRRAHGPTPFVPYHSAPGAGLQPFPQEQRSCSVPPPMQAHNHQWNQQHECRHSNCMRGPPPVQSGMSGLPTRDHRNTLGLDNNGKGSTSTSAYRRPTTSPMPFNRNGAITVTPNTMSPASPPRDNGPGPAVPATSSDVPLAISETKLVYIDKSDSDGPTEYRRGDIDMDHPDRGDRHGHSNDMPPPPLPKDKHYSSRSSSHHRAFESSSSSSSPSRRTHSHRSPSYSRSYDGQDRHGYRREGDQEYRREHRSEGRSRYGFEHDARPEHDEDDYHGSRHREGRRHSRYYDEGSQGGHRRERSLSYSRDQSSADRHGDHYMASPS